MSENNFTGTEVNDSLGLADIEEDEPPKVLTMSAENMRIATICLYSVISPVIIFFGLIGNSTTIAVLKVQKRKTSTIYLLLSLTIANIVYLLTMVVYVTFQTLLSFRPDVVKSFPVTTLQLLRVSYLPCRIGKLVTATLVFERMFAVFKPLKVREIWTPRCTVILSICLYIGSVAFITPTLIPQTTKVVLQNASSHSTFAVILQQVKQNKAFFERYHVGMRFLFEVLPVLLVVVGNILILVGIRLGNQQLSRSLTNKEYNSRVKQERKLTKSIVSTSIMYLVLCLPYDTIALIVQLDVNQSLVSLADNRFRVLAILSITLEILNSSASFLAYSASNKRYRKHYARLFQSLICCCRRQEDDDVSVTSSSKYGNRSTTGSMVSVISSTV